MVRLWAILLLVVVVASPASAQLEKVLKGVGNLPSVGGKGLSDVKIGSGLQEALKVGTENAVLQTSAVDGFLSNEAIKILMPKSLQTMEKPLRLVGYGPQIDEFIVGMNRAAEKSMPFAKQIFWDAIGKMTFDDARKILNGSNTAATDYFKTKTSKQLQTTFRPKVEEVMNQVGVNRQYNDLMGRYKNVPFSEKVTFDVNQYVTEKAIDGLFLVVSQEEQQIRTNPEARVTDLLKDVFGNQKK